MAAFRVLIPRPRFPSSHLPALAPRLKLYIRRLRSSLRGLEVFARLAHSEDLGGEIVGKAADVGVVLSHRGVVVLPCHRNPVLGPFELSPEGARKFWLDCS